MIDVFIWIAIIGLFLVSFVSVIYPIIPGSLLLWIGFLLYHMTISGNKLTTSFWIIIAIFTVILIISDIITSSYFVKKFGGSKWGERVAAIAVIIGSFIMPPFGILFLPLVAVLIVEIVQKRTMKEALFSALGSFIGFLSGTIAKVLIQLIMILWFFIVILWK